MPDDEQCFWHSPAHSEDAAAARKLGGQRRRREHTVAGAYEVEALDTVAGIRRVLQIATLDALGMDHSVARVRLLIAAAQALSRLLETGELANDLAAIRSVLEARLPAAKRRR